MRPIVIVTGASHGIGAATAWLFATQGFDVCINYLSDTAAAAEVVEGCKAAGARAIAVQGDVGKKEDIEALFRACDDELGRVTCLVNNAGIIGKAGKIEALQPEMLEPHSGSTSSASCTVFRKPQNACPPARVDRAERS